MKKPIHIAIAEDHLMVRQGMIALLKEFPDINILFDVSNGKELLKRLKKSKPQVILLDIEMPIMDGKTALEKVKLNHPLVKIIVISSYFDDSFIVEFVKLGASAFLPKNCDITKVVEAINTVHDLGYYYDTKVSSAMAKVINHSIIPKENTVNNQSNLTEREVQIIKLVGADFSNKQIAQKLHISTRTVEGHRAHIRTKTGCLTVLDFSNFVYRFGLNNLS